MIARLTLLFVVFAFASGNPAAGKPWTWKSPRSLTSPADPGKSSRIVGGNEATPHSHPYYAALYIDNISFCSGSLISPEWVLTAAHCIEGARFVDVVLGAHNLQENEATQVTLTSSDYVIHEDFNGFAFTNDIAVIRLPSSVDLNANIATVGLPSTDVAVGSTVTAIGWGKESDSATDTSPVLREVDLAVISNTDCNAVYTLITAGEVCTDGSGGKGTCNGDEGGPLLQGGKTYGVSSYETVGGCEVGNPDVFTRVYRYLDWIEGQTGVTP